MQAVQRNTDDSEFRYLTVPTPWEPIDYLCYDGIGIKAFKHPSGVNVHIINTHLDRYIAQKEDEDGGFEEERYLSYREAARVLNQWMENYE